MGITYEPSVSQQIGSENIQNFGKMIGDMIHPNLEFQKAMTTAVSKDPKLAQSLADLEHNAPGSLASLGFGSVGAVLSHMPESPENQALRENRPEAVQAAKMKVAAETATSGVTIERMNNLFHALKNNKQLASEDVRRILTGQTADEASLTHTQAQVAAGEAPEKMASSQYLYKQYEALLNQSPSNSAGTDYMQMAQDYLAGKNPPGLQQLLSMPTLPGAISPKDLFDRALGVAQAKQREGFDLYLNGIRSNDITKRQATQHAYDAYKTSDYAGSMSAWNTVLTDPNAIGAVKAKDPATLTPDDKDILAVANAQGQLQKDKQLGQVRAISSQLGTAITRFQSAKNNPAVHNEQDLTYFVGQINAVLLQLGGVTHKYYVAHYDTPPGGSGAKSLYFTNTQGHLVDPQVAMSGIPVKAGPAQAPPNSKSLVPNPGETKADMWQRLRNNGLSADSATKIVTAAFPGGK